MKKRVKKEQGITLIALMITVIVLLILAGVTLSLTLGERGIFKTASEASLKTERAEIIEQAKLDIVDKQTENELVEILNKYGTLSDNGEETILDKTLTSKDDKHEIKVSEIWDVPFENTAPTGKIAFTISGAAEGYGGSFEVEYGTTWEEFFNVTFPYNGDPTVGWYYLTINDEIISNITNYMNTIENFEYLVDSKGNHMKRQDIIIQRTV